MSTCEDDLDCVGRQVCYLNVSWAPDEVFCACDSWFGWEGSECDTLGAQTFVWIFVHGILTIFSFGVMVYFAKASYGKAIAQKKRFSPVNQTLIALNMYLFSRFLSSLFFVINITDVDGFGINRYSKWDGDFARKRGSMAVPIVVFETLSIVFGALANVQVGLVWVETAHRTKNMRLTNTDKMKKLQRAVRVYQVVFSAMVTAVLAYSFPLIFAAVIFGTMLLFAVYYIAWKAFNEMANTFSRKIPEIEYILLTLKRLLICQISLLISSLILAALNIGVGDSRDLFRTGKVSTYSLLVLWVQLSFLASGTIVYRFVVKAKIAGSTHTKDTGMITFAASKPTSQFATSFESIGNESVGETETSI
mmetsp:Transcript_8223/g.9428  ORF Transcript_8223/g.9428 Transcript_8223/m.9428 type:complete len:363 (-) Transcript_8223:358-1446(-)